MSISAADFERACDVLQQRWEEVQHGGDWVSVRCLESFGSKYAQIVRRAKLDPSGDEACDDEVDFTVDDTGVDGGDEGDEGDEESVVRSARPEDDHGVLVVYDILLSVTYRVPVVYLTFRALRPRDLVTAPSLSLDEIYKVLVPSPARPQMQAVGAMGALSLTDHPITNLPVYFVHPCRTMDAMDSIGGGERLRPEGYLLVWLGLVGQSVGLNVPTELAVRLHDRQGGDRSRLDGLGKR